MTFTPPTTCSKGKGKVGKSISEDPSTALEWAHNVITDNELKGLSSIPSHELVSCHIHKLVQVFHLVTFVAYWVFTLAKSYDFAFVFRFLENPYLSSKEKVVVATLRSTQLRLKARG